LRRKLAYVIGIFVIAVAGVAYTLLAGNEPLLGLDLQGGASVVLEPTGPAEPEELEVAVEIIRNRVDGLGVAEPEISTQGGNILVQLPGVDEQQRALDLVGQTAELRFRPTLDWLPEQSYQAALETAAELADLTDAAADDTTNADDAADADSATGEDASGDAADSVADSDAAEPTETGIEVVAETNTETDTETAATDTDEVVLEIDPDALETDAGTDEVVLEIDPDALETDAGTDEVVLEIDPDALETDAGTDEDAQLEAAEQAQLIVDRFAFSEGDLPADTEVVLPQYDEARNIVARYRLGPTAVTGDGLEGAVAQYQSFIGWHVAPTFISGSSGIDLFNDVGGRCHARGAECPAGQIAIELDNEVVSAPSVQADSAVFEPFDRSSITISGSFTEQEARDIALVLDYGALPVELEAQQSQIVSASLGTDALSAGILAGLIGLGLVSLYLLIYYRLLGLVAIASLGLSGAMLWTIIAWLGESQGLALTLAGVTGLIVAIGVSVDSNVVYFEHLREDVRSGRTLRSAVDRAFPVAFSTIVKADLASLIAAAVLYLLTVGQVRGFALYLGLATILDLVATYFFMGPLIGIISRRSGLYNNPARFGIPMPVSQPQTGVNTQTGDGARTEARQGAAP